MTDAELVARSEALAAELMSRASSLGPPAKRRRRERLRRLLTSPAGSRLVFGLADRVLRPVDAATAAAQLEAVVGEGVGTGLSPTDSALLHMAASMARFAPFAVVALVGTRLRYETRGLILPAEPCKLGKALRRLRAGHTRPNLNLLGEAVLGEAEAARRLAAVERFLNRSDVDCVSVKASAIAAGLSLIDLEGSIERVRVPLQRLYHNAARWRPAKLVNLDMEEHSDLDVTIGAFTRALASTELAGLTAGIAIQAYLPESHAALERLLSFATARTRSGGAPVRVRLVKGANLSMERALAELAGWPPAPYASKAETDASYKALLERLVYAARAGVVEVGAASHNLFDVAFGLVLAGEMGAPIEIEMLAGMADDQAAAVAERTGQVLLYAPAVARRDYRNALAYLARRLDENATPEGFLRQALSMEPGSPEWADQAARFAAAVSARHEVRTSSSHQQDRSVQPTLGWLSPVSPPGRPTTGAPPTGTGAAREPAPVNAGDGPGDVGGAAGSGSLAAGARATPAFVHEPPTDLTLRANRRWAQGLLSSPPAPRPQLLDGEPAGAAVDAALALASRAAPVWAVLGEGRREELLLRAGSLMAAGRGDAIAVMAAEAGKTFEEADPEVSEGIDYARWYASGPGSLRSLLESFDLPVESEPLGVVVVAPPWNFPYAIPAGATMAALGAGNVVVLKPAPEAPATSALLARQLEEAGLVNGTFQLLALDDGEAGRRLVSHPATSGVVLTGSYATAQLFARWAPTCRLLAETSGKNAIVVAASADTDQAVRDIVASAFGHAGQKCSAASLAIVEASVYDRGPFLRQLADATRSLRVGPATDPATQVGPIVGPFTPALERALTRLDPGESWLVEPGPLEKLGRGSPDTGLTRLWSPGVRIGVKPYSWAHLTEWFGPVLAVMRARSLEEALHWQNAVAFGLTAGLSSLDPNEQLRWADVVEAGNLYINRPTTGAVVGRQPFGGWKRSTYGPTAKAGGPNYLIGLRRWRDAQLGANMAEALASYQRWWESYFSRANELAGLQSESNVLRYRPFAPGILVRAGAGVADEDLAKALALSALTGTPVSFSVTERGQVPRIPKAGGAPAVVESDESFAATLAARGSKRGVAAEARASEHVARKEGSPERLRLLGKNPPAVYVAAAEAGLCVLDEPMCSCGRLELVRWLREQVISRSLHRYGHVVYSPW